ncbi:1-acylglycerol-3-phosphate O-acyltransferase [Loxospora ochrophaea]|nr:1-acylglycerol-3-phosphate O-acyltransferase [Loxospora ochrophaea]
MYLYILYLLYLLTTYLGLTLSLFSLSSLFPTMPLLSFLARLLASYASLLLCAIFGVVASIALRAVGHHRVSQWATARSFKYTMAFATGVRFNIVSGSHYLSTRPAVFIGNHQSELDILLLGTIFPPYCSVTAKKSLKRVPFLGWFMALSGTVFIDRGNRETAMKAFDGAAGEMRRERQSVFIFPEGTRSYAAEPTLLGFKKGAFHLAVQAGVDVVPVVAACYGGLLSAKEWRFLPGEIPVKVLPPISTKGLTVADVEDLTRTTRDLMLKELMELTASPMGQKVAVPPGSNPVASPAKV